MRESFLEVLRSRQAELGNRLFEIDTDVAVKELLPLAQNYLTSHLFRRINSASVKNNQNAPINEPGIWSELSFRLRRPNGILTGTIDKLLITRLDDGSLSVEIIDFKTNRIPRTQNKVQKVVPVATSSKGRRGNSGQFAFDFETSNSSLLVHAEPANEDPLTSTALDYKLQMQAYALAVKELLPFAAADQISVTLHFLEPNMEFQLSSELLETEVCARAIDEAMNEIVAALEPAEFPVNPSSHCRMCNFLNLCPSGQQVLRARG